MNVVPAKTQPRRARDLYLKHGNGWLARPMEDKRVRVNLRTSEGAVADEWCTAIEHDPLLRTNGSLDDDIDASVAYKRSKQAHRLGGEGR